MICQFIQSIIKFKSYLLNTIQAKFSHYFQQKYLNKTILFNIILLTKYRYFYFIQAMQKQQKRKKAMEQLYLSSKSTQRTSKYRLSNPKQIINIKPSNYKSKNLLKQSNKNVNTNKHKPPLPYFHQQRQKRNQLKPPLPKKDKNDNKTPFTNNKDLIAGFSSKLDHYFDKNTVSDKIDQIYKKIKNKQKVSGFIQYLLGEAVYRLKNTPTTLEEFTRLCILNLNQSDIEDIKIFMELKISKSQNQPINSKPIQNSINLDEKKHSFFNKSMKQNSIDFNKTLNPKNQSLKNSSQSFVNKSISSHVPLISSQCKQNHLQSREQRMKYFENLRVKSNLISPHHEDVALQRIQYKLNSYLNKCMPNKVYI